MFELQNIHDTFYACQSYMGISQVLAGREYPLFSEKIKFRYIYAHLSTELQREVLKAGIDGVEFGIEFPKDLAGFLALLACWPRSVGDR
jgi:hypothetical protein